MNQRGSKNLAVVLSTALVMFTNVWSVNAFGGSGRIDKVWLEERVKVGPHNGLIIHVKFNVKDAVGQKCRVRANFYTPGGNPIFALDEPDEYSDNSKHAVVTKEFSPRFPATDYADTKLAMPYWVLNLKADNPNNMKFFVAVRCAGEEIARSEWVSFSYPMGKRG